MFVLIDTTSNHVLAGPMHWNANYFTYVIDEDLGIENFQLPRVKDDSVAIIVDGSHSILPAVIDTPALDSKIEQLAGPFWTISGDVAQGSYTVVEKPIDVVRSGIKTVLADARWKKEVAGVEVQIQGQTVTATTSREDRGLYLQALQLGADNAQWKFGNVWLTLPLADLQSVVSAVANHVQGSFDWESAKCQAVDAATTLAAIKAIYDEIEQSA